MSARSRRELPRRQFLGIGAAAVVATAAANADTGASTMAGEPFSPTNPRIGLIGAGGRGTSLLQNLLAADVRVPAICDIVREKAERAKASVEKAGQAAPAVYVENEHAFEKLLERDDLEAVIIATP